MMSDRVQVHANGREAVFGTGLSEVGIGSDRSCLVRVHEAGIAPRHLVLRHQDGAWFVEALDGAPVFVRGLPVERREIDGPLELRLGDPDSGPVIAVAPAGDGGAGAA